MIHHTINSNTTTAQYRIINYQSQMALDTGEAKLLYTQPYLFLFSTGSFCLLHIHSISNEQVRLFSFAVLRVLRLIDDV